MIDLSEFESIRPYDDEEAVKALGRVSRHPMLPAISKSLFPKAPAGFMGKALRSVKSIDEFQRAVMLNVVNAVLAQTSEGFTVSGTENLKPFAATHLEDEDGHHFDGHTVASEQFKGKRFLAMSNHRDIVIDPALICYTLRNAGIYELELCVGSNLLQPGLVEDLLRSNRMIKVIRGISGREMYLSSQILSKYIRLSITSGNSCVWIAQREGRTKDGLDVTEQGLLKMFDMSGEGSFEENFKELNIVPMSISYEYEPCDSRKARETLIRQLTGTYKTRKNEDTHSIMTGIRQQKGHIHLAIGKPLSDEEMAQAAAHTGNDRYKVIRAMYTKRIIQGYKLWKTNYMGYDLMNGHTAHMGVKYLPSDLEAFKKYTEHKLSKIERRYDRDALRDIFWHIYGNPVQAAIDNGFEPAE